MRLLVGVRGLVLWRISLEMVMKLEEEYLIGPLKRVAVRKDLGGKKLLIVSC